MLELVSAFIEERYIPFEQQKVIKSSLKASYLDNSPCSEPAVTDTVERGKERGGGKIYICMNLIDYVHT